MRATRNRAGVDRHKKLAMSARVCVSMSSSPTTELWYCSKPGGTPSLSQKVRPSRSARPDSTVTCRTMTCDSAPTGLCGGAAVWFPKDPMA